MPPGVLSGDNVRLTAAQWLKLGAQLISAVLPALGLVALGWKAIDVAAALWIEVVVMGPALGIRAFKDANTRRENDDAWRLIQWWGYFWFAALVYGFVIWGVWSDALVPELHSGPVSDFGKILRDLSQRPSVIAVGAAIAGQEVWRVWSGAERDNWEMSRQVLLRYKIVLPLMHVALGACTLLTSWVDAPVAPLVALLLGVAAVDVALYIRGVQLVADEPIISRPKLGARREPKPVRFPRLKKLVTRRRKRSAEPPTDA